MSIETSIDRLIRVMRSRSTNSRPFVTLTYACSLDGSIAAEKGQPLLLSSQASMTLTHQLRTLHEAILVGVGTVTADNPRLTARLFDGPNPTPVIVDPELRTPLQSACLNRAAVIVCRRNDMPEIAADGTIKASQLQNLSTESSAMFQRLHALISAHPETEIIAILSNSSNSKLEWTSIINNLNRFSSIMIEGGASVIRGLVSTLVMTDCPVDHVLITIAPLFVGGTRPVDQLLSPMPRLCNLHIEQVGTDAIVQGFVKMEPELSAR